MLFENTKFYPVFITTVGGKVPENFDGLKNELILNSLIVLQIFSPSEFKESYDKYSEEYKEKNPTCTEQILFIMLCMYNKITD